MMVDKNKLISELEDVIYSTSLSKKEADYLISRWIKLIDYTDLKDYKINIISSNKLIIKHKAFAESIPIILRNGFFFLGNAQINDDDVNYLLPTLFY